ncbi:hypothetical protein F66182_9605 [Fusarium sp. NRRL 66182]|nr:hypothetical protein F66182_9605 [Fusarium sp. NRRL 66182]
MAAEGPNSSAQPKPEPHGTRSMSGLEIGLMVGSILFFVIMISSIFIVRGLEQRRRAKEPQGRAEDGNVGNKNGHQIPQENDTQGQHLQEHIVASRSSTWKKMRPQFWYPMQSKETDKESQASSDTNTMLVKTAHSKSSTS